MYEVHIAVLSLEFFFLKYALTFALVKEGEHVWWLSSEPVSVLVKNGVYHGSEIAWSTPFLRFAQKSLRLECGLPVSGTGIKSGVAGDRSMWLESIAERW